jgi:nucleotide-binding universal stress UspA family protein
MSETLNPSPGRIVVGVDGSKSAAAALRWAVKQAEVTGDSVLAIAVWQYPIYVAGYGWAPVVMEDVDMEGIAEKTLAEAVENVLKPGSPVRIERRVVEGYAPSVLVEASEDADLLVVGSRGHGTFTEALLGSVSQHCSHHAKCPVVIVRGEGR